MVDLVWDLILERQLTLPLMSKYFSLVVSFGIRFMHNYFSCMLLTKLDSIRSCCQ